MRTSRRSIYSRRRGRGGHKSVIELPLTSMMDILVIILVFLLKAYSTTTVDFATVAGLKLPISASKDLPTESLQVIVTPEAITFEDQRVVEFVKTAASIGSTGQSEAPTYDLKPEDLDSGGLMIIPLYDALVAAKQKADLLRAQSNARDAQGQPLPFDGILAIQADRRVDYSMLKRIMHTAAQAEYRVFRFLAEQKPE